MKCLPVPGNVSHLVQVKGRLKNELLETGKGPTHEAPHATRKQAMVISMLLAGSEVV